jgi:hypothetical protein
MHESLALEASYSFRADFVADTDHLLYILVDGPNKVGLRSDDIGFKQTPLHVKLQSLIVPQLFLCVLFKHLIRLSSFRTSFIIYKTRHI